MLLVIVCLFCQQLLDGIIFNSTRDFFFIMHAYLNVISFIRLFVTTINFL